LGTIRFLLALAVVCAHVGRLPFIIQLGSLLAVQSFYIISGFLIALVWTNKYERLSSGLFLFYSNRAARIYILYWVVLVASIVVALVTKSLTHDFPSYFGSAPRAVLPFSIFTNTWIFGSSWAYWLGYDVPANLNVDDGSLYFTMDYTSLPYPVWRTLILGPAWTLDLELCFYLLAPFLAGLRLRYIFAIIAASQLARFSWYAMGHDVDPWNYRFFPFEIGLFMLGAAAYQVSRILAWQPNPKILVIVFAALVGSIIEFDSLGLSHSSFNSFLYLLVFAALIPYIFNLTRSWTFDRFLADMSFPLYLAHWTADLCLACDIRATSRGRVHHHRPCMDFVDRTHVLRDGALHSQAQAASARRVCRRQPHPSHALISLGLLRRWDGLQIFPLRVESISLWVDLLSPRPTGLHGHQTFRNGDRVFGADACLLAEILSRASIPALSMRRPLASRSVRFQPQDAMGPAARRTLLPALPRALAHHIFSRRPDNYDSARRLRYRLGLSVARRGDLDRRSNPGRPAHCEAGRSLASGTHLKRYRGRFMALATDRI
jgi:peptidoglycan/LPS O-acetylase OafA/YrhL